MRAALLFVLLASGCGADVCSNFSGQTCIALQVQGNLKIDQLGVTLEGVLSEQLTPEVPRTTPVKLPVEVAILPGETQPTGGLVIDLRGLNRGVTVGTSMSVGLNLLPNEHRAVVMTLGAVGGTQQDLAGVDLAGQAGRDLSTSTGPAFINANAGLFGGDVQVLLADFANGGAFAGTSGAGLFRTGDSGNTWVAANNGLDIPFVTALARDSITGAFYVSGSRPDNSSSVFRSTDDGASWTKLVDHLAQTILVTSDSLAKPVILLGAPDGILRSEDNGATFTPVNTGLDDLDIASIIDDPLNKGTLDAASLATKVFESTDFGDHWSDISTGLAAIGQNGQRQLRRDPHTSDLVLLTLSGLFERTVGASSFTTYSPAPPSNFASSAMEFFDSGSPDLYVAGGNGVFHLDGAKTAWTNVSSGLLSHDLFAVTVDLSSPSVVYTGGFDGVYVSTNSGGSWNLSNQGITNLSVSRLAIDPKTPSTLYAGTQRSGVQKSLDGGATWTSMSSGLSLTIGVSAITVDPQNPSTVFLSTQDNNTGQPGVILRSTNGGGAWTQVDSSAAPVLLVDPRNSSIVFAGGLLTNGPALRRSVDGGQTFNTFGTGLTDLVFTLVFDPTSSQILYAGTLRNAVFKSTDGGDTWSASATGITETQINSLAIDPNQPTHLWASGFHSVYRSTDAGATWTPSPTGLTGNIGFNVIAVDSSGTVFTSGTGLFRSDDGGASWSLLDQAPLLTAYDIAVDPQAAGTLYYAFLSSPSVLKTTTGGR